MFDYHRKEFTKRELKSMSEKTELGQELYNLKLLNCKRMKAGLTYNNCNECNECAQEWRNEMTTMKKVKLKNLIEIESIKSEKNQIQKDILDINKKRKNMGKIQMDNYPKYKEELK